MGANKYDGHSGRSGVVFIRDNVYQKIAYINLLKFKNPGEKIDVLTKENILDVRNSYSKVYVICDYLFTHHTAYVAGLMIISFIF